jgi:HD superfamily phosphohydrolase
MDSQIETFVAAHLPVDVPAWLARYKRGKIIHDSLWGTFEIQRHEIAILDTPLLQRLRFIRQTGAVYLTYPSAVHTRFEHTLGVLCQAGRMCSVFRNRPGERRMTEGDEINIRVAALLHDTGHGPFSHTSEQYFSSLQQVEDFRESNEEYEHSGAGEILSCLMVQSTAFRKFIAAMNDAYQVPIDGDTVSKIISGNLPDDRMFVSEIIHGPFDADKIDYMHRDGMFSGLKMHVDLDRLFASIDIKSGTADGQRMIRLAGSLAGTSPLTQIMFNKMLLFTGIYHHHKVRTVDCMRALAVAKQRPYNGHAPTGATTYP